MYTVKSIVPMLKARAILLQIDSKSIPGRHRRLVLPVDTATSSSTATAASTPFEAGRRCVVRPQQRRTSRRPIAGYRRCRRHPRRPTRRRRLAVSMEADAWLADTRASVAERCGRHPQPRQSRVRVFPAAR